MSVVIMLLFGTCHSGQQVSGGHVTVGATSQWAAVQRWPCHCDVMTQWAADQLWPCHSEQQATGGHVTVGSRALVVMSLSGQVTVVSVSVVAMSL